jgi:nucleoporin NDC1
MNNICTVLSLMVCASLSEDKFGIVQRDIPRILEAMISFRSAIEEYKAEVKGKYVPPPMDKELTAEEIADNNTLQAEVNQAIDLLSFAEAGKYSFSIFL